MIKCYFTYFWYLLKHKWYVFWECCRLGIPWRGLVHDLSKFLPSEFFAYAKWLHYYKPIIGNFSKEELKKQQAKFDIAYLNHQHRNKHHWQYWVLRKNYGETRTVPMPYKYIFEMLADWYSTGMVVNGRNDVVEWYMKNQSQFVLHPETRDLIERFLDLKSEET